MEAKDVIVDRFVRSLRGVGAEAWLAVAALASISTAQQSPFHGRLHDTSFAGNGRVFAADLDADGDVDLVNTTNAQVEVHWNQGDATFAKSTYSLGSNVWDVTAADWDADGDLDLFGVNYASGTVTARRKGNGTSYAAAVTIAVGSDPRAIRAADLDADGWLDLVVATYSASSVLVLRGTGASSFAAPVSHPIAGYGYRLELADFDGDGVLDVATANLTGAALSVLRGLGNATFAAHVSYGTGFGAWDLETVDHDRDGDLDVALATTQAGTTGNELRIYWNLAGAFTTWSKSEPGIELGSVAVGELDGDLEPDMVVTCFGERYARVVEEHGGLLSTTSEVVVGPQPNDCALADVTGDGWLDLMILSRELSSLGIHEGRGDGTFEGARQLTTGISPHSVYAAEFTGDGVLDVALVVYSGAQLMHGLGGGDFAPPSAVTPPPHPTSASAVGDVEPDGDLDIVIAHDSPAAFTVLANDGAGNFTPGASVPSSGFHEGLALGDLDGDQDLDVVLAFRFASQLEVHANLGNGTFGPAVIYPLQSSPSSLALADFDGDQDLDVAAGCLDYPSPVGGVCVALNDGTGAFGASSFYYTDPNGAAITANDLDGDGDVDLATVDVVNATPPAGRLTLLMGNGNGTFVARPSLLDHDGALCIASVDIDDDGDFDLLTGTFLGSVALRTNQGGGTFVPEVRWPVQAPVHSIALADVDADLDVDWVVATGANIPPFRALAILSHTRTEPPKLYCAAKANSNGCTPSMSYLGAPSASLAGAFTIAAGGLLNQKAGLLFYGHRAKAAAFQGGTLCVSPPTRRTPVQSSGGSASPANDCSGTFALDLNAWIQSGVDPVLVVGVDVYAQHWSRDPASASTTGLTNAIHFEIRP